METTLKASSNNSEGNSDSKSRKEIVDLFPYRIKRREHFYFRKHPKNLNPNTPQFKKYWGEQLRYYVEGRWINDEGHWVYMMPKLCFYINYARVYDKDRKFIHPRLRDTEWIVFTYFLCMDGFSGFEDDTEFTCHHSIKEIEGKKDLGALDRSYIPESCKKKDGTWKKYVDPWHYLTRHYLIENPAKKPLGLPLYDNPRKNGIILSGRGVGKSYMAFVGDFAHEFLTNGVKRMSDLEHINAQLNFGMGCADARQLERSVANIKSFYDNMPGQYESEGNTYMGALYKNVQGNWNSKIQHIVKRKDGTNKTTGNLLQCAILTPDKTKVGAGDRFRRIYIEEVGFLKNLFEVHRANKDSMIVGGEKVGSMLCTGTGGDIQAIQEPKTVFERVDAYDVFGIPNYWKNPDKRIGLFIPSYYASERFKDAEGNTILEDAHQAIMDRREKLRREIDADSYESEIMFNPVKPDEMLRPSGGSVLPKQAAAKQLDNLEIFDIFRNRAMIGDLNYNPMERRGVEFKKDLTGRKKPILKWEATAQETNSEGAVIIYEQPGETIPEGLYYVIFDPVQKSGSGSSYNSILVYKNFYRGSEESLFDTIVAEWIGRKERLEDNYHMVIKFAKYFNAKIFPETNVAGFVEWCGSNNYYSMLESDGTYFLKQELNSKSNKSQYYKVGFQMQKREKDWALRKLRDWLLDIKRHDPATGIPVLRTIDWIFSPRILEEIIGYSAEDDYNFDHISSLLGLMILIGKLGKEPVDLEEEKINIPSELQAYHEMLHKQQMLMAAQKPQRSRFLQY